MLRNFALVICTTLTSLNFVYSQDCPPGNVIISSQSAMDNWLEDYEGCEVISGNLTIRNTVEDISGLSSIRTVEGNLVISTLTVLTNLTGLGGIQTVGGNLSISGNTELSSLAGLGALQMIGGDLVVGTNDVLPTLQGLNSLQTIGEDLWISQSNISSLEGLESLTTVTGQMFIQNAHALQDLSGLDNLSQVGWIQIWYNDGLQSLNGLEGLTTVDGLFRVTDLPVLSSVSALSSLQSVGGDLAFHSSALTSVENINALTTVEGSISVYGNAVTQIVGFEQLTTARGGIFIDGDMLETVTGFRNVQTIGGFRLRGTASVLDLTELQMVTDGDLDIKSFELTDFTGCDKLQSVGGTVILQTGMTDLPDFPELESVGGMLLIDSRETLEVLDGFNNLTSIGIGQLGWGFDVYEHDALTTIQGFERLASIEGDFVLAQNDLLTTVIGFQELRTVAGSFSVSSNQSLLDCSPFCPFMREGTAGEGKYVRFNGEFGDPCWDQDDVELNCTFELKLIDANPKCFPDGISMETNVRALEVEDVALFDTLRNAICADGVTEVILRIEVPEEGTFEIDPLPENIEMPWGDETLEEDDRYFMYLLYTAPETFDPGDQSVSRYEDTTMSYQEPLSVDFINNDMQRTSYTSNIRIVRPPVVLVHGTFSNPMDTWQTKVTTEEGHESFQRTLELAGYFASAVNYTNSNGDNNSGPSSFADNTMVVYENPGGIMEAVDYYRHTMRVATTQADVVGHSMGGVLPRVYASTSHYNMDEYERLDNFMEGDINRLITIAATHYGSHLGELQIELEDASPFDLGPLDWLINFAGHVILKYYTGVSATEAVRDQQPAPYGGEALNLIGATPIPSHAITASVPPFGLKDPVYDPMEEYYDLYWYTELMMYYNTDVRELYLDKKHDLFEQGYAVSTTWNGSESSYFKREISDIIVFSDMIDDAIQSAGKLLSVLDGSYSPPSGAQLFKWAYNEVGMSDIVDIDPFIFLYQAYTNPIGVISGYVVDQIMPTEQQVREEQESLHEKSIEGLRSLIFNNDANDGVVSVSSQRGNIDVGDDGCADCTTNFDGVLHGFAPRYSSIQSHVIHLLDGGMQNFSENGFPDPEEVLPLYYPPNELDLYDEVIRGDDAICQSGMVPGHARAYARIADQENSVVIVRPVNPDATPVIARGAATKVMDVKPKSSNFGPQKGYLPADQRYSKIWKLFEEPTRTEQINKYNQKVTENLANMIVSKKHLVIEACNVPYEVHIDQNKRGGADDMCAEDEIVLVPVQNPNLVCYWGSDNVCDDLIGFTTDDNLAGNCIPRGAEHDLVPFEVIATPGDPETSNYITADYDLLMIGFYEGEGLEYSEPQEVPFREGVGQLTSRQETLIDKLNAQANHTGGNVTHHGPENQFKHSPYIDYPLTVFAPDDNPGASAGEIISIRMGPKGFRDINLKKYVNDMRNKGYDLVDNPVAPGWQWVWNEGQEGFQLEDHQDLADYVEEMPQRDCNKITFGSICDAIEPPPDVSNEPQSSWLFPPSSQPLSVTPSLAVSDHIMVTAAVGDLESIKVVISDLYGNKRSTVTLVGLSGVFEQKISIADLEEGIFVVTLPATGASTRFVRM